VRVSISIDEESSSGVDSQAGLVLEPPPGVPPDGFTPPAELAARAAALGALSAGPAPGLGQGPPVSGAPAITPAPGDQQPAHLGAESGPGGGQDLPAGAAPGQPDPSQSVGHEL